MRGTMEHQDQVINNEAKKQNKEEITVSVCYNFCIFFLLARKRFTLDAGIKLVTPPQPARFPGSSRDSSCDETPVPSTELPH